MRKGEPDRSVAGIADLVPKRRNQMPRFAPQSTIAALMVAYAILVPAAHARPIESPGVSATRSSAPAHYPQSVNLPPGVARTSSGANPAAPSHVTSASSAAAATTRFDWRGGGVGAR